MTQVNRKGEKPASSPALEELLRRQRAENRKPTDRDAPPLSTFPGTKPKIHEGQLSLQEQR